MTKSKQKKSEKKSVGDLVYGVNPICELLKAKQRKILNIYTTKPAPKSWNTIKKLLPDRTQIHFVDKDVLARLAGTTDHQSVVAFATPLIVRKKFFDAQKQPFLVMLDGIQDPRNLGAILRSAHCTGVDGVIIAQKNSAPLNAVALKSSAGLAEHMAVYVAPSASAAVVELKQAGYSVYLSALEKGTDATKVAYEHPLCVVIGSEGAGITKSILSSGTVVTLPQRTNDISYNASVAAGILMFLISQAIKK